ncbi:tRNA nucleotidyltransferase/poly(A) polymerase [Rhodobacteraceae bacterium HIMB11]|nr:tRNA nucleotidyltransferase/poly(A) polymerase [Rhodobacteraceae bacterium HIMB11]
MTIDGAWIKTAATQAVFSALESAGYDAFFVGGCVRNALMGFPVDDLDIATNAQPHDIITSCENRGLKCVPTGIDHGTITVISDGIPHEITTYRRDVQGDGRHAIVEFSTQMQEDAARRDFTINALYADRYGKIYDPLGTGKDDLNQKRVTFIGSADERIREDYLRILRFFRFSAIYADQDQGFNPETLAIIANHLDGLDRLSKERIGAEMRKLLSAPDPTPAIAAMRSSGALMRVLEGTDDRSLALLVHLESECDAHPNWLRRLAILGVEDARECLRLSNDETQKLAVMHDAIGDMKPPHALGYHHGASLARDILLLRWASFEQMSDNAEWQAAAAGAEHVFPIKAQDLMPQYSGPALGQKLRTLETQWIDSEFRLTKKALLNGI